MDKRMLYTPAITVDLDSMEQNLVRYAELAAAHGKELWPMVKTHKSTELAMLQQQHGCTGFLCGTLDEAESLCAAGIRNIMYAYPIATDTAARRVVKLAQQCNIIVRIDGTAAAAVLERQAAAADIVVPYTIIIDSGLHRFGVMPDYAADLANALQQYSHLQCKGISTHPGHVYGACTHEDIAAYCRDEVQSLAKAADVLRRSGYNLEMITSGSTPTFAGTVADPNITIYHPGNYIFNDAIQLSTDTAQEDECALTVLSAVISQPRTDLFLCDAGSKCLGLDQGAHGNTSITGYGVVKGHPELCITGLSEEVGKIHVQGKTDLRVGDLISIIPNHSCSSANMTDYLIGMRGDDVERLVSVDIRGNSTTKHVQL